MSNAAARLASIIHPHPARDAFLHQQLNGVSSMALPSQTARPLARRSFVYRRGRRNLRPIMLIGGSAIALIIVLVLTWQVWSERESGSSADTESTADLVASDVKSTRQDSSRTSAPDPRQTNQPIGIDTPRLAEEKKPDSPVPPASPPATKSAPPQPKDFTKTDPGGIEMGGTVATPRSTARPVEDRPALAAPSRMPALGDPVANQPVSEAGRRALSRPQIGYDLISRNQPVEAREVLSQALLSPGLPEDEARRIRRELTALNDRLIFGQEIVPGDPFAISYPIASGDALSLIPKRMGVQVDWRFIQRINRISDPRRIHAGQKIKLITGPFHAIVDKSEFRMDLFLGDSAERVYVRSFPVGLGEANSTPEGRFRVRDNSKLINPEWVNPRTRDRYLPDDPKNPIGEHWIGLVGDQEHLTGVEGYGIHGTIEPDSIGREASMGCVRMNADDVALVWEMLLEKVSTVQIQP